MGLWVEEAEDLNAKASILWLCLRPCGGLAAGLGGHRLEPQGPRGLVG